MGIDEIILDSLDEIVPAEPLDEGVNTPFLGTVKPPYFLMRHVVFNEELSYVLTNDGLPVYHFDGCSFTLIGKMRADLSCIIKAKFLDTDIVFVDEEGVEQNLSDPLVLTRFIVIHRDDWFNAMVGVEM